MFPTLCLNNMRVLSRVTIFFECKQKILKKYFTLNEYR